MSSIDSIYSKRVAEHGIYASIQTPFITTVLGPRRVGKSTLITHFMEQHAEYKWVIFNMDKLALRQRAANNQLQTMIEEEALQKIGQSPKIWVVIDEAQKCPELFEQIKILYDDFKDTNAIKFILTGSALLQLHQLSSETLAGRIFLHYLREFSLQESIRLSYPTLAIPNGSLFEKLTKPDHLDTEIKNIINELSPFRTILITALEQQLCWGGFPEVITMENKEVRYNYLGSYLQTYLEKDIRDIKNISDITLYQNLMQILAQQTGSLRDDEKILSVLKCARNTLKKYRDYLIATLMVVDIYPYIQSSMRRLIKSPKTYFLNNGLISYLTGIDDISILKNTGLIGHRFENWFLKELKIWLDRDVKFNQIYFWRTSSNTEVDFVVEKASQVFPFEVTYSNNINAKKLKNLKQFLQENPKTTCGFYVYSGDYYFDAESRIYFLPAWIIS